MLPGVGRVRRRSTESMVLQDISLEVLPGETVALVGRSGAGKTTFLSMLESSAGDHNFYSWQVPRNCDNTMLFRHILQVLGLRPGDQAGAGELIYSLRNYAQNLERSRQRVIFAFDDAHNLGNSELAALISVLQGTSDAGFGLHFVLFAEPGLAERIDALHLVDVAVQDAQLPGFSPAELNTIFSNTYLAHDEPLTLNGEALERVWVQSQGLPGRALDLARSLKISGTAPGEPGSRLMSLPIWHLGALTLLAIVLIWALAVREGDNEPRDEASAGKALISDEQMNIQEGRRQVPIEIVRRTRPGQAEPGAAESAATGDDVGMSATPAGSGAAVGPESANGPDSSVVREGDDAASDERLLSSEQTSVTTGTEPAADSDGAAISARIDAVLDQAANSPAVVNAETGAEGEEPTRPESVNREAAGEKKIGMDHASPALQDLADLGEKALLTLIPNGFVIQIMATSTEDSLHSYIARQPNRSNLLVHRAYRDGKRMYLLVEGFYADKDAALAAVENLPQEQRDANPWPKQVSVIHEEIRQVRRN